MRSSEILGRCCIGLCVGLTVGHGVTIAQESEIEPFVYFEPFGTTVIIDNPIQSKEDAEKAAERDALRPTEAARRAQPQATGQQEPSQQRRVDSEQTEDDDDKDAEDNAKPDPLIEKIKAAERSAIYSPKGYKGTEQEDRSLTEKFILDLLSREPQR